MRFYRIPYCVPDWGWAEHLALARCLVGARLIEGPDIRRLLEAVRSMTGARWAFGFGSGSEAIYAALKAWRIGTGDRVILPSYCCDTVAAPVIRTGADCVFCDIGDDFNLDAAHALSLVDDRVKGVIVPHLFGRPARIDLLLAGLEKLDRRRDVLVLDDAAQSFGARLGGRWLGTFPDAGIVSFGPAKTITASGGGLLLTGSAGLAEAVEAVTPVKAAPGEKLRALAYWLVFRRWRRYTLPAYPVFRRWLVRRTPRDRDLPEALANVDAALAVPQLERLQDTIRLRGERKERLDALISACRIALASAPPVEAGVEANTRWVAREERAGSPAGDLVREFCLREGLEIQPLYQPLHLKRGTPVPADLRKSEALAKRIVQFPIESSVSRRAWRRLEHKLAGHLARAAREAQAPSGRNAASGAGPSPD